MDESNRTRKAGLQNALLAYIKTHPDQMATIDQLEEAVPGWSRSSYSAAMNLLAAKYTAVTRLGRGAWGWSRISSDRPRKSHAQAPQVLDGEMTLRVLKVKDDGKMLVQDTTSMKLFLLEEFDL